MSRKQAFSGITALAAFHKAGPYIGPRGGKWADPQFTIPWHEPGSDPGATLQEVLKRRGEGEGKEIKLTHEQLTWILKNGTFGLISAGKNPKLEPNMTQAEQKARHEKLRADLRLGGYVYTEVEGHYEGKEPTFLVMAHNLPENEAKILGKKYNQDSVIHAVSGQNKMHYTTGDNEGQHRQGNGYEEKPDAKDYYTIVKHPDGSFTKFALNFDWDKLHKALEAAMSGITDLETFAKAGGPFIGPRGGKWADAAHTIPWEEDSGGKATPPQSNADLKNVIGRDSVSQDVYVEFNGHVWHVPRFGGSGPLDRGSVSDFKKKLNAGKLHSRIKFEGEYAEARGQAGDKSVPKGSDILGIIDKHGGDMLQARREINKNYPEWSKRRDSVEEIFKVKQHWNENYKEKSMASFDELNSFAKSGPYIGPKGGKWADPEHKIPWTDQHEYEAKVQANKQRLKERGEEIDRKDAEHAASFKAGDSVRMTAEWYDEHRGNAPLPQGETGKVVGRLSGNLIEVKFPSDSRSRRVPAMNLEKRGGGGSSPNGGRGNEHTKLVDGMVSELKRRLDAANLGGSVSAAWSSPQQGLATIEIKQPRGGGSIRLPVEGGRLKIPAAIRNTYEGSVTLDILNAVQSGQVKKSSFDELNRFAKSGGPFIGPHGGKWADPEHKIPWKEDGEQKGKKGRAEGPLTTDELAKKPLKWLRTRQEVIKQKQRDNYERAVRSEGGLRNPPPELEREMVRLDDEEKQLMEAIDRQQFQKKTERKIESPPEHLDKQGKAKWEAVNDMFAAGKMTKQMYTKTKGQLLRMYGGAKAPPEHLGKQGKDTRTLHEREQDENQKRAEKQGHAYIRTLPPKQVSNEEWDRLQEEARARDKGKVEDAHPAGAVVEHHETRGGKYAVKLHSLGDGRYQVQEYTNGKSARTSHGHTLESGKKEVQRILGNSERFDNIHYHPVKKSLDRDDEEGEDLIKTYTAIRNAYEKKYGAGSWSKIKVSKEAKTSEAKPEKLPFGAKKKLGPEEHERYTEAKRRLAGALGMPTEGWGLYGRSILGALKDKEEKKKAEKSLSAIDALTDFAKGEDEVKEHAGDTKLKADVLAFLKKNPNPEDEVLHKWAESKGYDVHEVEDVAYTLATQFTQFAQGGKSNAKHFTEKDADPKQLKMGIQVESEHTPNPDTAKRIALDHLAEIPDYYTRLKAMEKKAEKSMDGVKDLEDFVKGGGEGSRGGHVIGHTAGGKPIYESKHDGADKKGKGKEGEEHQDRKTYFSVQLGGEKQPRKFTTQEQAEEFVKVALAKQKGKGGWQRSFEINHVTETPRKKDSANAFSQFFSDTEKKETPVKLIHDPRSAENYPILNLKAKEEKKKSMEDEMTDLRKAQGMPTGDPKLGSGPEQGGSMNGVGKTGGSNSSSAGEAIGAPGVKTQKLSEDDEDTESQMKPGKKPIEKLASKSWGTSPQGQRDSVAQERAAAVSRLEKGQSDVRVGVGIAPPVEHPEQAPEVRRWDQGADARVFYSDSADQRAAALVKSEEFYPHGSPTVDLRIPLAQQAVCTGCKSLVSKSLSACPVCGLGAIEHRVMPGGVVVDSELSKSESGRKGPLLRPKVERDLVLPSGYDPSKR